MAALVAALVTCYHAVSGLSSSALVDAGPVVLFLCGPSDRSAVERSPDCECVWFGSDSFEVLSSRRSKLRFLRDGS